MSDRTRDRLFFALLPIAVVRQSRRDPARLMSRAAMKRQRVGLRRKRGSLFAFIGRDTSITLWRRGAVAIRVAGHEWGMYFGGWFQAHPDAPTSQGGLRW